MECLQGAAGVCIGVVLVIVLPLAGYMLLVLHWMQDGEQVS
jgi:hypothetical protein